MYECIFRRIVRTSRFSEQSLVDYNAHRVLTRLAFQGGRGVNFGNKHIHSTSCQQSFATAIYSRVKKNWSSLSHKCHIFSSFPDDNDLLSTDKASYSRSQGVNFKKRYIH